MFAILSDIHANLEALTAVLADIDRHGVERVVCLGDIVGYGPDPVACINQVRQRCEVVLMGDLAVFVNLATTLTADRRKIARTGYLPRCYGVHRWRSRSKSGQVDEHSQFSRLQRGARLDQDRRAHV